jgi:quercetin dioxygenase-like cupin family protein
MQVTIAELSPDLIMTTGLTRTIYPGDATVLSSTGSGPVLQFVESGTLTVTTTDGRSPYVVRAGTPEPAATPAEAASGEPVQVTTGEAFLLAPGTTAEIRNDGADPAAILGLLSAPDASVDLGEGISQEILVRQDVTLPEPPLVVTLSRVTLEPGDRLSIPAAPAVTLYTTVERRQVFSLTGQGINRFGEPLDAYILVIEPESAATG